MPTRARREIGNRRIATTSPAGSLAKTRDRAKLRAMSEPILELSGLTKVYPGGLKALDDVGFPETLQVRSVTSPWDPTQPRSTHANCWGDWDRYGSLLLA